MLTLSIKAFVKALINLSPRYVNLRGTEGQSITGVVEIRAGLDKPLTLEPGQFDLEGKVKYTIEEIEKGRKFKVRFTNIPGFPQPYRGFLKLKTNYPEKPEVTIWIKGWFAKAKKGEG